MAATSQKLSQRQILSKLGVTVTPTLTNELDGNGRSQQYYNQLASIHGLPEPFSPSTASAIIQDLIPLSGLVAGADAAATDAGAAATGGGTGDAAASGAGGASTGSLAKGLGAVAAGAGLAAGASSLAGSFGFLTNLDFWKGLGLVIAGAAILVFAALEFKEMAL